jgi:hypothetical protein
LRSLQQSCEMFFRMVASAEQLLLRLSSKLLGQEPT